MTYASAKRYFYELGRYWRKVRLVARMKGYRALPQEAYRHLTAKRAFARPEIRLFSSEASPETLTFPIPSDVRVSVVVEARASTDFAHRCLASLLKQTTAYQFEVIVAFRQPLENGLALSAAWKNVRVIEARSATGYSDIRNSAAAAACGEFLVFLADTVQVQEAWLDALTNTFLRKHDAGVVGCRVVFADGRLQDAGGELCRDGSQAPYGYGDDPSRPEYSYLRRVDYCSPSVLAIRSALFRELNGFSDEWGVSEYSTIDLVFRAKLRGSEVYYQPNARVVNLADDQNSDANTVGGAAYSSAFALRPLFAEKRAAVLSAHRSSGGNTKNESGRQISRRIFIADYALPAPDRDSGSVRMFNLLLLLLERGFSITFASVGLEAREPYLSNLQGSGVQCLYKPYEHSIQEHLRRRGSYYDLVILSRFATAAELHDCARRYCRRARIVFDTVDLHFQRLAREAEIRGDARLRKLADRKRSEELRLIAQSDTALVVSEVEREYLAHAAPTATVRVLSNIHEVKGCQTPFAARRDILFVGGFAHPPNEDAVAFFCEAVLPHVQAALPGARFLVIGADPPSAILQLASENVQILGQVPDIAPYLNACRLSVAPLRFGAGVKGKINQSLAHGLPVVATTLAVEGMFLEHGHSVLVADNEQAFAEAVVTLYADRELWLKLSRNGLAVAERCFSLDAARVALESVLSELRLG